MMCEDLYLGLGFCAIGHTVETLRRKERSVAIEWLPNLGRKNTSTA